MNMVRKANCFQLTWRHCTARKYGTPLFSSCLADVHIGLVVDSVASDMTSADDLDGELYVDSGYLKRVNNRTLQPELSKYMASDKHPALCAIPKLDVAQTKMCD